MGNWRTFVENNFTEDGNVVFDKSIDVMQEYTIYPDSVHSAGECTCFIAREKRDKVLIVVNSREQFEGLDLIVNGKQVKICPLNSVNSHIIRHLFPFTNPIANRKCDMSVGLGDRLGVASPGHIRLVKGKNIFPVLAQQSVRELTLTNRTFEDVLSSAVWAVFQEGYRDGYGADGDHLKTAEEVKGALDFGYTMITLDCSEHIHNEFECAREGLIRRRYDSLDEQERQYWEGKYKNRAFDLGSGKRIQISEDMLGKTVLMYRDVLAFVDDIYRNVIKPSGRDIDFEISIDETSSPTSPEIHYIIASEIRDRGVSFMSLAPRFCGEFQKGIDYRGDIGQFKRELAYHAAIAEHFGFKISVHSGSDKFSVFPAVGEMTRHRLHIKTAGTNWLEALGVIVTAEPALFMAIYRFALDRLDDAKKYYHISTEKDMVPDIGDIAKDPLHYVRHDEAVRQVLHVTYGYILCEKDADGRYVFRDRFYRTLDENEQVYYDALCRHIGRHLQSLGIGA